MTMYDWFGRTIISQYGLICEVLAAELVGGVVMLRCHDPRTHKNWDWEADVVSLVTRVGEVVDPENREVYGRIVGDDWDLYPDNQCRILTPEEMEAEWKRGPNADA